MRNGEVKGKKGGRFFAGFRMTIKRLINFLNLVKIWNTLILGMAK
jgi:hypothetical protein